MKQKMGYYITFSGVDGAGKSTQTQLLSEILDKKGFPCCVQDQYHRTFHALTQTHLGSQIDIRDAYKPETAEVLMICDEILHFNANILPLLQQGITVISARSISDRYLKAKLYKASNAEDIKLISGFLPNPDLHLYLKVDLEQCLRRIELRGTDSEDPEIMRRYIALADRHAETFGWTIIDSNTTISQVSSQVESIVFSNLNWYK